MATRRPKGTGSIYTRKDGRVIGQYEIEIPEGKKRKYVSGKTKKEVPRKLGKAIADSESRLVQNSGTLLLNDYLDRWIDNLRYSTRQSIISRIVMASSAIPSPDEIPIIRASRKLKDL